ncbi:MAG: acyltransferase family protein, partial [Chloroflexota bacterium]
FGVDLFFVLSGYVISLTAATKPATFLQDRLTRIFPGYLFWALAWLVLASIEVPLDGWTAFTTLTLIPAPQSLPTASYVVVGWTLTFELLFYLAMWLVLRGVRARWLLCLYGFAAALAIVIKTPWLEFLGSPMVAEFLLGVLAFKIGQRSRIVGALAMAMGIAGWMFMPHGLGADAFDPTLARLRLIGWGPAALLLVWGASQFRGSVAALRPLALLGDASYSIYLSNLLLFLTWEKLTGRFDHPLAGVVLAIALGLAAYLVVERPLLRAARRLGRPRLPRPQAILQAP